MSKFSMRSSATSPAPRAWHFTLITLAYLAFAVYGSLVPLDWRPLPFDEAVDRYWSALWTPLQIGSRTDLATNVLLFMPLSFGCMAALCVDRPRVVGWVAALAVPVTAAALSASIEFVQVFIRSRVTSNRDIVAETLGAVIGAALWLVIGARTTAWLRRLQVARGSKELADWVLPGYFVLVLIIQLMPLDLTISPAALYRKYRQGGARLVPLASLAEAPGRVAPGLFWTAVYFAPIGVLLATRSRGGRHNWPWVFAFGLAVSGLVEGLQLFVLSRSSDITSVLVGGLAVLAGWLAIRFQDRLKPLALTLHRLVGARNVRPAALWTWCVVLLWVNWSPFDFNFEGQSIAHRLGEVSWLPLADYFRETELGAFEQIVRKLLLSFPLGVVLSMSLAADARRLGSRGALLVGLVWTTLVEMGQLALPGHYFSLTDIILGGGGTWLGSVAIRHYQTVARRAAPSPSSSSSSMTGSARGGARFF